MLEAHDDVIGEAPDDDLTLSMALLPSVHPKAIDVIEVDIGQQREHTNLIEAYTVRASRRLDEACHPLAKLGIWHTDHCGVADRRMGNQDLLDFDRRNVRTAANNQVLLAGNEPEITLHPVA